MPDPSGNQRQPFPSTRWTLISRAGNLNNSADREALSELIKLYIPALRTHLTAGRDLAAERADDLLQDFVVEKLLERNILTSADPLRGKFRTFLLTTLDRFMIDEIRRAKAEKRSPKGGQTVDAHEHADVLPDKAGEPSAAFELAWARRVLDETVRCMRAECAATKRSHLWGLFEGRVLKPMLDGVRPESMSVLVERFKLNTPAHASNQLSTAKRMFTRIFRTVIGQYATDDQELDNEVRDLWNILSTRRE